MRKTLLVVLALAMALTLVIGSSGIAPAKAVVEKDSGAYVKILGIPVSDDIEFEYGWNNSNQFATPAVGYWLGLYDVTNSHYEWASENQFTTPGPGTVVWNSLKLSYEDTTTYDPGQYKIVFFVRGTYGPATNVAAIEVPFSTLWITVAAPKGGVWPVNSSQTITWSSMGVSGNVDILLSRDGGATFPENIGTVAATDGTYTWLSVTGPATAAKNAVVAVVSVADPTVFGTSGKFTIK